MNSRLVLILALASILYITHGVSLDEVNDLDDGNRYALNEVIESLRVAGRSNGGFTNNIYEFEGSGEESSSEFEESGEGSGEKSSGASSEEFGIESSTLPRTFSRVRRAKALENFYYLPSRG
ncbi:unnamed protein product [Bursaphelenchus okinawaensis]|uniref:Uncharacterized protein n=1 Tax=Bursaphelenchus okinawaensis TaxID=465554 RepID=A0A811LT78_9BILA|nr:unnamed protein product [Bursaphelenchus okinawaensis]CAG9127643.1 unnamed protein product [Bursaphelenchus okinawaensis]